MKDIEYSKKISDKACEHFEKNIFLSRLFKNLFVRGYVVLDHKNFFNYVTKTGKPFDKYIFLSRFFKNFFVRGYVPLDN